MPAYTARTVWAAYTGTVAYSVHGISLHNTRRAALLAVIEYCDAGRDTSTPIPAGIDDDDLAELAQERADAEDTDWTVSECQIPAEPRRRPKTRQRRPGSVPQPALIDHAIEALTDARTYLVQADAPRTLARVRLALTSAHGARRHAIGMEGRQRR